MWVETLLERNLLPDPLIRTGIRRRLAEKLREEGKGTEEERLQRLRNFVQELKQSPIAVDTEAANEQHYEVPPGFFEAVLGKHLKYSCGYWPEGVRDLNASEEAMLDLYCERAELRDGQKILDLGCGWGSLSLYLARKYPKASITGVSNSGPQREYIMKKAGEENLKNLKVLTADMNLFQSPEHFDRILSIEMFEHMRNYKRLLEKILRWLEPGGLLFVHIFSHRDYAYPYEVKSQRDWMARYFFTGGIMPSQELLLFFDEHLRVKSRWQVSGLHYEKTCNAWLKKMDGVRPRIMELFRETYGSGEAAKWRAYWRVFFMACAELFGYDGGKQWFVSHYLFEKAGT